MTFVEVASFDVVHAGLSWPWLAFDASGKRFAFAASDRVIATRVLNDDETVVDGPTIALPADLSLPSVRAFSIDVSGTLLAIAAIAATAATAATAGTAETASVIVTCDADGERCRSTMETLAGPGFNARAVTFDRSGTRLWISAESETETALLLIDARSHTLVGMARSAVFPPPATHELYLHPQDDAVLLLAACGEAGTFARVVGWSGGGVETINTAMDQGSISAGFVGFSADAARVHLAEADELRTHAWPELHELSSVELVDDFVGSYAGAVIGHHIYVDGAEADSGDDAVMRFDRSAIRGRLLPLPVPEGMWAGRLGADLIVTVESKGDPARGRVIRVAGPGTSN